MIKLSKQYHGLGEAFSRISQPSHVHNPKLLLWNDNLAQQLNINRHQNEIEKILSGNQLINGSQPVAIAYSGHQFGQFNPHLGDGRAHLLGELIDQNNQLKELQLKGSGRTPFSRSGDGKCGIKPAVREFLMSEAMHSLNVPSTRCLSVVTTGEDIFRQTKTPGAIVCRVASSHLRVGTFEYFAARGMHEEIKILADFAITRHFPEITTEDETKYIKLIAYVIDRQIDLIVNWMRVGFIHGVMNTDNTLLSGETIDYGPCAMLGVYDPATVFSSIDHNGRYAFGNQAKIAQWNMVRLAECLLSNIHEDEEQAIDLVTPFLEAFPEKYNQAFDAMMAKKLGFSQQNTEINQLQQALLDLMFKHQLDYTQTFNQLQNSITTNPTGKLNAALTGWQLQWIDLMQQLNTKPTDAIELMTQHNPLVIPRNHHVEDVLNKVESSLTAGAVTTFLAVLQNPYVMTENTHLYQDKSPDDDLNYQTFCGT